MNWDCAQLEERLSDYLEGRLRAAELAGADAHVRACPRCAEWLEARQAILWLRQLEPLESPPGLETRILALTGAPPPEESFWSVLDLGWRSLWQPRVALGLSAAVLSLTLVLNAFDVSLRDLRGEDLKPGNLYRTLDRRAHLTYARGTRFVNDLRLVYEIRSRLGEPEPEAEPPASAPPASPDSSAPKGQEKREAPGGGQSYWLLAYYQLGLQGELR